MTYSIPGLDPAPFAPLFARDDAALTARGAIRALLDNAAIAYIDAHNAAHGCFAARIERHERAEQ